MLRRTFIKLAALASAIGFVSGRLVQPPSRRWKILSRTYKNRALVSAELVFLNTGSTVYADYTTFPDVFGDGRTDHPKKGWIGNDLNIHVSIWKRTSLTDFPHIHDEGQTLMAARVETNVRLSRMARRHIKMDMPAV